MQPQPHPTAPGTLLRHTSAKVQHPTTTHACRNVAFTWSRASLLDACSMVPHKKASSNALDYTGCKGPVGISFSLKLQLVRIVDACSVLVVLVIKVIIIILVIKAGNDAPRGWQALLRALGRLPPLARPLLWQHHILL